VTEPGFEREIERHYLVLSQIVERYDNYKMLGNDYTNELKEFRELINRFLRKKRRWDKAAEKGD